MNRASETWFREDPRQSRAAGTRGGSLDCVSWPFLTAIMGGHHFLFALIWGEHEHGEFLVIILNLAGVPSGPVLSPSDRGKSRLSRGALADHRPGFRRIRESPKDRCFVARKRTSCAARRDIGNLKGSIVSQFEDIHRIGRVEKPLSGGEKTEIFCAESDLGFCQAPADAANLFRRTTFVILLDSFTGVLDWKWNEAQAG